MVEVCELENWKINMGNRILGYMLNITAVSKFTIASGRGVNRPKTSIVYKVPEGYLITVENTRWKPLLKAKYASPNLESVKYFRGHILI